MTDKPSLTMRDVVTEKLETPFQGYFQIDRYHIRHKKFDGSWTGTVTRELFERGHAVACVLYDPEMDALVMVEQFRIGAYAAMNSPWFDPETDSPWMLEHIAGIIEQGEAPEDVVKREAVEEAGTPILDLVPIHHCLMTQGGSSESCFMFCARVDASKAGGIHGLDHEDEDIQVHVVPFDQAIALMQAGRINNAMTIVGLQWLQLNKARLLESWA